ncbi:hypothetical protein MAR_014388, partial [Mya arenaria]
MVEVGKEVVAQQGGDTWFSLAAIPHDIAPASSRDILDQSDGLDCKRNIPAKLLLVCQRKYCRFDT